MRITDGPTRNALHDDAYRYAFRRSLSARLSSVAAVDAVEAVEAVSTGDISERTTLGTDAASRHLQLIAAARASLERYLPPSLPPRIRGNSSLQAALAALPPSERELLLLRYWDSLGAEDAGRAAGEDAGRLPSVLAACVRLLSPPVGSPAAFVVVLESADPALSVTQDELERSRRALPSRPGIGPAAKLAGVTSFAPQKEFPDPGRMRDDNQGPVQGGRKLQAIIGAVCLVALVVALATALIPRTEPGPAGELERLYELADVVAVLSASSVEPTLVSNEVRMRQSASVVQIVKGQEEENPLIVDVTGRSTLERPYSRNFFPPHQIMFLTRGQDGILAPIEGEGSVLTLSDLRTPEVTTTAGDPVPMPAELRAAIDGLPEDQLTLATSGQAPGSLDADSIIGIRPDEGRDTQNLPGDLLGTFRGEYEDNDACFTFDFNGRTVLIRWPEGFSAYDRERTDADGDSAADARILTVLNERGYPYVDHNRQTPFIRGVPTGERGACLGQELEVWDIAVAPASTLLFY
ncbi:MAG: hypothetical protein JWM61_2032 [Micrococcaceae bacterium]|jgi:hypothetical protein|nr:hypothetical protein [Micrococcaceae bacterium]